MLPTGSTLGILGGGQLGRMIAHEARRLGYKIAVIDASPDCPAAGAADYFIEGRLDNLRDLQKLAEISDVLTVETEHVPADLLASLEETKTLRPKSSVLANIQDRLAQRKFLDKIGVPQPRWAQVDTPETAVAAATKLGLPAIMKSRRGGYDGKGQVRLQEGDDVGARFAELDVPAVMEAFVSFDRELSILIGRDANGNVATYPVAENEHRGGILHITKTPTEVSDATMQQAEDIAHKIAEGLDHVGVLCVELFDVGGALLVNEVAPRVHNSGHFSFSACITSQFEQHARAVLDLPLGDTTLLCPTVMLNILGDAWQNGSEPDWSQILATPKTTLHLYGKAEARPGRKMGHLLVMDDDVEAAVQLANDLHHKLTGA